MAPPASARTLSRSCAPGPAWSYPQNGHPCPDRGGAVVAGRRRRAVVFRVVAQPVSVDGLAALATNNVPHGSPLVVFEKPRPGIDPGNLAADWRGVVSLPARKAPARGGRDAPGMEDRRAPGRGLLDGGRAIRRGGAMGCHRKR